MAGYTEYYTVVYRDEQRMVILNDNAKPKKRPKKKPEEKRRPRKAPIGDWLVLNDFDSRKGDPHQTR